MGVADDEYGKVVLCAFCTEADPLLYGTGK